MRPASGDDEEHALNGQTPPQIRRPTAIDHLLLTTGQAADALGLGRTTVYALIKEGELRPIHIGRSCRISRAELERYVDRLETRPVARK